MKIRVKALLWAYFICSTYSATPNNATSGILNGDLGGWQFHREIVAVLDLARSLNKEYVEFEIVEVPCLRSDTICAIHYPPDKYREINAYSIFRCYFTSDSTTYIEKTYKGVVSCYAWVYEVKEVMGIYYTIKEYEAGNIQTDTHCQDITSNSIILIDSSEIYQLDDTTVFHKRISYHTVYEEDTLPTLRGSEEDLYFFLNERIIRYRRRRYSYPSDNTLVDIFREDDFTMIETWNYEMQEINSRRSMEVISVVLVQKHGNMETFHSTDFVKQEYLYTKEGLPRQIEVLESEGSMGKIKGSYMNIKYR